MRYTGIACSLMVLLGVGLPARGAFYQFTVEGTVAMSDYPAVSVGDPVAIGYVGDATDLDASPTLGIYRATRATFTFPGAVLQSDGFSRVEVLLNDTDGRDWVRYLDLFVQSPWAFVEISFPGGTLQSDALPPALSLAGAEAATFRYLSFYYNIAIRGEVESYASVEVPEPQALAWLLAAAITVLLKRRGTRACARAR